MTITRTVVEGQALISVTFSEKTSDMLLTAARNDRMEPEEWLEAQIYARLGPKPLYDDCNYSD